MGFFKRFGIGGKGRVMVIGLDGTPYSLMTRLVNEGQIPNFARLLAEGSMRPMTSVHPAVSSVAWATIMTGVNPGKHGIYGFVDRSPGSYKTYIPTARNLRSETLWEVLSRQGKRVVVINVPVTYPPRPVNGVLIAGFLSPNVEKAVYPPEVGQKLKEMNYRLDIDPWGARESKEKLLEDFRLTLAKRSETILHFMDNEPWDFFIGHVMETDRLHHFLWEEMESGHERYASEFYRCYAQIDDLLGQVWGRVGKNTTLIIMSDHGFCTLLKEVYVNRWLVENGWLKFEKEPPESLEDISAESRAYSLDPGRIYVNLKGREPRGAVEAGREYDLVRRELAEGLQEMKDPATGERMVDKVLRREEVYSGPCFNEAPDLIVVPCKGYDLKGAVNKDTLTYKGALVGMHTYDDAFLYLSEGDIAKDGLWVGDVMSTILDLMDVPIPEGLNGHSLTG
ncbi:MAG: alkaline phosphatase family protein [Anaerolineae bacterium]